MATRDLVLIGWAVVFAVGAPFLELYLDRRAAPPCCEKCQRLIEDGDWHTLASAGRLTYRHPACCAGGCNNHADEEGA